MAVLTKQPLSASTLYRGISVTGTTVTAGVTVIHAAATSTGSDQGDEVVMYGYNSNTTAETVTIAWGSSTGGQADEFKVEIPPLTKVPLSEGLMLRGSLSITAAADTASKVTIFGYVVRAT
jgi:hypothetical protein